VSVIEQFWYTRPAPSAARDPGFQIVARSPGFVDPRSTLTRTAITLCRYDMPPRHVQQQAPESYGWADAAGVRYCFRRAAAGTDEFGRRGNLTAHILAGPPQLLPAAGIAARLGSPWWWAGGIPADPALPTLADLADIPAAPPAPPAEPALVAAFLDALLTRPPRGLLALRCDPAAIVSLVLAVEDAVPRLMDAHSLSTYESPRAASLFDVVGTMETNPSARVIGPQPDLRTPPAVIKAREILLGGGRPRVTRAAAQAAGIGTATPDVPALAGLVTAYSELDAEVAPSARFLTTILASAETLQLTLAEFPRAAQDVARKVIGERGEVFAALSALAIGGLADDTIAAIGAAAGQVLADTPIPVTRWDTVLGRLADLDRRAHDACRRILIEHLAATPTAAVGASGPLRLSLLRQAAADGLPTAHPAVWHLLATLGEGWGTAIGDPAIPVAWQARVLGAAINSPAGPQPAELSRHLLSDPALIGPLAAELTDLTPLRDAVGALAAADQPKAAAIIAAGLPPQDGDALAVWFADRRTRPDARLAFLAECARRGLAAPAGAHWPAMAGAALADWLAAELASVTVPRPPKHVADLLRSGDDLASRAWLSVLGLAEPGQPAHVATLTAALRQASLLPPEQAQIAVRSAITFFAVRRPSAEQFTRALPVLADHREPGLALLADTCLLVLRAESDIEPVLALGRCVLDLVARDRPARNSDRGREYAAQLRRLAREAPRCRDSLAYYAARRGNGAPAWWRQAVSVRARIRDMTASNGSRVLR
jgi:hypothetical protein